MTYVIRHGGKATAFTGGVIHDGAKMTIWFDTEWDYGFGKGIDTLIKSVESLIEQKLDLVLPSHGPAILNPQSQFQTYRAKLAAFRRPVSQSDVGGNHRRSADSHGTEAD